MWIAEETTFDICDCLVSVWANVALTNNSFTTERYRVRNSLSTIKLDEVVKSTFYSNNDCVQDQL